MEPVKVCENEGVVESEVSFVFSSGKNCEAVYNFMINNTPTVAKP